MSVPLTSLVLKWHYKGRKRLSNTGDVKKVLVLAPHMDDETIGPGGTIRSHANEGSEVHCVFITDGSSSVSDLSKDELIKARKQEIENVKEILGVKQVHYMGLSDGHVISNHESQDIMLGIINEVKPDLIYSPLFVDAHPDHTATANILADVLKKNNYNDYLVRMYEINCAIPPNYINCVVDVSSTIKYKREAIDEFISQTIAFDGFLILNKYKSNLVSSANPTAVEVFLELSGSEVVKHRQLLSNQTNRYQYLFKQINREETLLWALFKNYRRKKDIYMRMFE
ncbi:PIG-L deacetylase family protein [Virgibacillus sp. JSM 102003]